MEHQAAQLKIKLQIYCGEEIAMGPGKADLLQAIAAHGSITAAGKAMGMSYRRAWLLVDVMNRCWAEPLVATAPGRAGGSGARLTPAGKAVLATYLALVAAAGTLRQGHDWQALSAQLRLAPL
ncbi:MAG TPA: LysR family transcriptional regulator, partial [Novosphingobium sp.]|nr:LysR family transcriptional regulator [Novosphingobium sp.]